MERAASTGSIIWGHRNNNSRSRLNSITKFTSLPHNEEKVSAASSGYHGDIDSKDSSTAEQNIRSYKRRFYILLLFSITSFMQYCCWNTFGPISTSCMEIFDWTEKEIAFMASLDPFTYIMTMLIFSWMMDMKGLRVAMLVTAFFMAFGTGLRCITSKNEYVTWSMATGQFFNGLAGPVTQAAPTLLSANWFPVNERTTATAVASLMGSLGVALSFIIGPTVVKEIDKERYQSLYPTNGSSSYGRGQMNGKQYHRILADSIYRDAKYYWPFDNEHGFLDHKDENIFRTYQEYKNDQHANAIGKILTSPGVLKNGITTLAKKGWVNLGDFENECLGKPSLCKNGLSVAFWVNFSANSTKQFLLGTGGLKKSRNGFLVSVKSDATNITYMKFDVISKKNLWRVHFPAPSNCWNHIVMTWNETDGLHTYINKTLVARAQKSTKLQYTEIRGKSFTLGRVYNAKRYTSASFDEIALWEKTLGSEDIERTYRHALYYYPIAEELALMEELKAEKEKLKSDVMWLLYVEFGINAILFVLILIYFPDKPPIPPTKSSSVEREDFSVGVKQLLRSPAFWILCLIYGITSGVYSGWGSLLNVNLSSFGISQKEAGWLGFYAILAGVTAGMMLARCADLLSGRMKSLILLLFIGASGCFLWFCLLCLRIIPYSKDSLYKAAILGGFFISGTIPLFYELTVEQVYPIAEGTTVGLMTLINNIVTVIFLLILMIPNIGTIWMNWALCGSCIICLPVLALFKEKYNRLNIDLGGKEEKVEENNNKKTKESEKLTDSKIFMTVNKVAKCVEQSKLSLLAVPDTKYGKT